MRVRFHIAALVVASMGAKLGASFSLSFESDDAVGAIDPYMASAQTDVAMIIGAPQSTA